MSPSDDNERQRADKPFDVAAPDPMDDSSNSPNPTDFKRKFLENIGWSGVGMGLRVLCVGGTLALLSRIVDPATMGLYGVAWAAAALGQNVGRNGAAQGIIALPALEKSHVAAALALAALLSIVIGLMLALASPAVETFYGMEGLGAAFFIGGLFVPLMCLPAVDMALAQKELNFSRLTIIQTIAMFLASATALGLALAGYHLVSLFALQGAVGPYMFLLFRMAGQPLGLARFRMVHVRDIWRVGSHLSLTSVAAVLMQNLPQLIMAKFLSAEALGYYTFCYRIIQLIGTQLGGMVWTVIYPTFSSIQSDIERVGRAFLFSARYTAFALFLCLMVLVVAPGPFLELFGGDQWGSGSRILFFLAIMQMLASLGSNVFPTFQAIGKPSAGWRWMVFFSTIQASIVYVLARYGVEAVAVGMAASGLAMPLAPFWLSRVAGFPFTDYVRSMAGIILPVLPAIALGIVIANWTRHLPPLLAFSMPACTAGLVFVGLVYATDRNLRENLTAFVAYGRERMSPRPERR